MQLSATRHRLVLLPTLLTALVLLLSASPSRADLHQHPVLLPAKVDPSKCLECHNDKATGKYVHIAVSKLGRIGYKRAIGNSAMRVSDVEAVSDFG